ncbi:hypothetical protein FB45DRAFT_864758 [Roridomyces roridus]|uniref:Uncharacterized protein n=1 Tax=Roridomyces roridus TaxID=1738132 RepID=A0AAD7FQ88_9AGAR|nr:hypothetical protein FB45DRAFT_864758 [Roridomyces roridus]
MCPFEFPDVDEPQTRAPIITLSPPSPGAGLDMFATITLVRVLSCLLAPMPSRWSRWCCNLASFFSFIARILLSSTRTVFAALVAVLAVIGTVVFYGMQVVPNFMPTLFPLHPPTNLPPPDASRWSAYVDLFGLGQPSYIPPPPQSLVPISEWVNKMQVFGPEEDPARRRRTDDAASMV